MGRLSSRSPLTEGGDLWGGGLGSYIGLNSKRLPCLLFLLNVKVQISLVFKAYFKLITNHPSADIVSAHISTPCFSSFSMSGGFPFFFAISPRYLIYKLFYFA